MPVLAACAGDDKTAETGDSGDTGIPDLTAELEALDGVTAVLPLEAATAGTRLYALGFEQPVDHEDPSGPTFTQYLSLMLRDPDAPMALDARGYGNSYNGLDSELSWLLDGNRLNVEHRFFGQSVPETLDWSKLTVAQETADLHAITTSLRDLFTGPWIATGASKGGQNALLYRAAYPDDVDGTVAYVAPFNEGLPDTGYESFFDTVGDADCRSTLAAMQRTLLENRADLVARTEAEAEAQGETFTTMDADTAFQISASELAWTFWQYDGDCEALPADTSDVDAVWTWFLASYDPPFTYADEVNAYYAPYYYQCAAEFGYPALATAGFSELLTVDPDDLSLLVPEVPTYDPSAVDAAATWLSTKGDGLLLIYGEQDPWSVRALTLDGATDSYTFTVAGGNHGSELVDLSTADQAIAFDAIGRWTGQTVSLSRRARPVSASASSDRWADRSPR